MIIENLCSNQKKKYIDIQVAIYIQNEKKFGY